jgi:hypothetical protein
VTLAVTPKKQVGTLAGVETLFDQFGHHPGFEQGTPGRVGFQAARITDAEQPRHEPHVEEVQLGRLHQAFAEVAVVGKKPRHQVTGLQNRQPFARGGRGNATVGAQRGKVEPQVTVGHPHPHRQTLMNTMRHFSGARLGKGDAQDRLGRHTRQHQAQHARRQHLRLARPRRRTQPDMIVRLRRGALPAVERLEQLVGIDHAEPSSVMPGSGSPRPNHSSRRISWSKSA